MGVPEGVCVGVDVSVGVEELVGVRVEVGLGEADGGMNIVEVVVGVSVEVGVLVGCGVGVNVTGRVASGTMVTVASEGSGACRSITTPTQ